eukprot:TRINITY_DN27403_c0_g1_i2.p1 TRINITY_DN27403_c0_g1~~TRINITY_DN27403_c0_g1_i2.p1  ORF type:complete len:391 (-),score=22.71 TRINITY_DN27403_c0_g1_i2:159-1238(-)
MAEWSKALIAGPPAARSPAPSLGSMLKDMRRFDASAEGRRPATSREKIAGALHESGHTGDAGGSSCLGLNVLDSRPRAESSSAQRQHTRSCGATPDVHRSLDEVLTSARRAQDWRQATFAFAASPYQSSASANVRQRLRATTSVAGICNMAARWDVSLQTLLCATKQSLEVDLVLCNIAVMAAGQSLLWMRTMGQLAFIFTALLETSIVTYNAFFSSLAGSGQWAVCCALFASAVSALVRPDIVTRSAALSSCDASADWNKALTFLEEAGQQSILADAILWSNSMAVCAKSPKWSVVLDMLSALLLTDIPLDVVTFRPSLLTKLLFASHSRAFNRQLTKSKRRAETNPWFLGGISAIWS